MIITSRAQAAAIAALKVIIIIIIGRAQDAVIAALKVVIIIITSRAQAAAIAALKVCYTLRFAITAKVLAKCKRKYYRISACAKSLASTIVWWY